MPDKHNMPIRMNGYENELRDMEFVKSKLQDRSTFPNAQSKRMWLTEFGWTRHDTDAVFRIKE